MYGYRFDGFVCFRSSYQEVPAHDANFGIVTPIEGRFKGKTGKKDKNNAIADRALEHLELFKKSVEELTSK